MYFDKDKIYQRTSWSSELVMIYYKPVKAWIYATRDIDKGVLSYKKGIGPFSYSYVGKHIFENGNFIEIDSKTLERKVKPIMKKNVNYVGSNYQLVDVTYELEYGDIVLTEYTFKTEIPVKKGDLLVVESREGLQLVRATIDSYERDLTPEIVTKANRAKAWVVNYVDETKHNLRKEATQRREFLKQQLEERKAAMEEIAIYKMLADSDPEAAKLLNELQDIDKV